MCGGARSKLAEREEELATLRLQLSLEKQELVAALDEAKASAEHLEGQQRSLHRRTAVHEQQVSETTWGEQQSPPLSV